MVSMNRFLVLLMISLTTSAVFAGCHEPTPTDGADGADGGDGTDGGQDGGDGAAGPTVTLSVQDPPAFVTANESFDLTVMVEVSEGTITSTHSGFHYGFNSSEDAEPSQYTSILSLTSPHVTNETSYPGEYTVADWTISEEHEGETVYYRAHVNADGVDYWGPEESFIVNPLS